MSERGSTPAVTPTVLLISTSPSFSPARLSMAMTERGFAVQAVCPGDHTLRKTPTVRAVHSYNCLTPFRSISRAVAIAKPDLIIPCDDWAASLLHELYSRESGRSGSGGLIPSLIGRSLGAPQNFSLAYDRTALLALAAKEGLPVPRIEVVHSVGDLKKWAATEGFPAVLKANATSGGDGVRIVKNLEEAERAYSSLQAPPMFAKAVKRVVFDKDMALLWPSLRRRPYVVNIQKFVAGRDATSAVACWNGKVLASLQFEVLNKQDAGGPSTVLRWIESQDMVSTARKLACQLELSGLYGFDFILETATGRAQLIEMNPRATQVGHLAFGPGHDLAAALYAAVTGTDIRSTPRITDKDTIALFPQEWLKNPASDFLRLAYHDVPWEEPQFVLACMERRRKRETWYSAEKWAQALSKIRGTLH